MAVFDGVNFYIAEKLVKNSAQVRCPAYWAGFYSQMKLVKHFPMCVHVAEEFAGGGRGDEGVLPQ